jgi:hypothetical protein
MPRKPPLHSVDDLLSPALERTLAGLDLPAADEGLVALARVLAGTLDRMSNAERRAMMGQTAPLYLKTLVELETRAAKRRKPEPDRPSRLDELRRVHARTYGRR